MGDQDLWPAFVRRWMEERLKDEFSNRPVAAPIAVPRWHDSQCQSIVEDISHITDGHSTSALLSPLRTDLQRPHQKKELHHPAGAAARPLQVARARSPEQMVREAKREEEPHWATGELQIPGQVP